MDDEYMLTTYDNPINPFTDFSSWWKWDLLLGHHCCGLLAREALTNDLASDEENEQEVERAMDFIVQREPLIYRKVLRSDFPVKSVAY